MIGWGVEVNPSTPASRTAKSLTLSLMLAAGAALMLTFEAPITGSFATAAGGAPAAFTLASAIRSFFKTLTLIPLRRSWTHRFNCAPVGAVWRIDSNSAVTFRPAGMSARGLAPWWSTAVRWAVEPTAPQSSTRSSRCAAVAPIDGTN
jgi:hypothetical protein